MPNQECALLAAESKASNLRRNYESLSFTCRHQLFGPQTVSVQRIGVLIRPPKPSSAWVADCMLRSEENGRWNALVSGCKTMRHKGSTYSIHATEWRASRGGWGEIFRDKTEALEDDTPPLYQP
jgi:hypothetical protein